MCPLYNWLDFPAGLRLSQLEDTAYFAAAQEDSASDSTLASGTSSDSSADPADNADPEVDEEEGEEERDEEEESSESQGDSSGVSDGEVEVVWAKADRGIWGLGHIFNDKLYLTRDIMDGSEVPAHFEVPQPKPPAPAPAKPKPKAAPKPGGKHVQEFRMLYKRGKGFYSQPI